MLRISIPFAPIDVALGNFLAELAHHEKNVVGCAAQLASWGKREGNVCISLTDFAGKTIFAEHQQKALLLPPILELRKALIASGVVARAGEYKPLVLDEANRLYLHRYWAYEQTVAEFFRKRLALENATRAVPMDYLESARATLNNFFPVVADKLDWQKIAAALALIRNTIIITGGPGTGKTTAAAKIIAVLLSLAGSKGLHIALAAPTGKAALRLSAAVKAIRGCAQPLREVIPENSFTLHRLLGYGAGLRVPRYNRQNPLPYDLIVVDEASMIDLPIMANLAEAIKEQTTLILLGDKNQLASVEPGAIFGDLNEACPANIFSDKTATLVELLTNEKLPSARAVRLEGVVEMKNNHRFGNNHPLATAGALITGGHVTQAVRFISTAQGNLKLVENATDEQFRAAARGGLAQYLKCGQAKPPDEELFALLEGFRLLAVLRSGRNGVDAINKNIASFWKKGAVLVQGKTVFDGCPIMATRNNYQQGIFNGDVGIVFLDEAGRPKVRFRDIAGKSQSFPLGVVDGFEIAFATTVHKAQGSEFARVLLMLPETDSPVLTSEVIYTAITRARDTIEIWGNAEILLAALSKKIVRNSALKELLIS